MLYGNFYNSPIGKILIVCDESSLIGLWFDNRKYYKNDINEVIIFKNNEIINEVSLFLDNYFKGSSKQVINFKLNPKGTNFQKKVWNILLDINYGEVKTYKETCEEYKKRNNVDNMSYRAIGSAISKNPISIIIPCHRVIGKNNKLVGYAGGVDRKKYLLDLERKYK